MFVSKEVIAEWVLRLSLAGMYIWSGIDIVRHPGAWSWAVRSLPPYIQTPITNFGVERFIFIHGISELVLAAIFLSWFMPRFVVMIAALLSALEMAAITLLVGVDATTFRDIGLIGSGLALFFLAKR